MGEPSRGELPFTRVGIVGLGVMGGSLARALARHHPYLETAGWSPDPGEREAALAAGAVGRAPETLEEAIAEAELVVLGVPVDAELELLPRIAASAPEAVLSNVTSLQIPAAAVAATSTWGRRWVGSHPMVGSERSGFAASRADLFRDARVWLIPEVADASARDTVRALWEGLEARPRSTSAPAHDALMARASHFPQLAANLVAAVLEEAGVAARDLGSGGRDMTRLAASSPELWGPLLKRAGPELSAALRSLAHQAAEVAVALEEGDVAALERLMERTRTWKEA
ncbi:MAG: prephenate dehydrogenase [Gemmatimonadota bacterium]